MADVQSLSARVKKMAEIATEYKLWGRSRVNRNSLLDPLSTAFENLRRKAPEMDMTFVRAQTIEEIFAHLSRVRLQANPRFRIGKTKRQGITTYVDEFYRMVEEIYRGPASSCPSPGKSHQGSVSLFFKRSNDCQGTLNL